MVTPLVLSAPAHSPQVRGPQKSEDHTYNKIQESTVKQYHIFTKEVSGSKHWPTALFGKHQERGRKS